MLTAGHTPLTASVTCDPSKLSDERLAAETAGLFVQCHAMAALSRGCRGFHTARPAANYHHRARASRTMNVTEFKLAPGLGMLDARDRNTKLGMADAGLIAGDTGTDVIDPTFA